LLCTFGKQRSGRCLASQKTDFSGKPTIVPE